MIKKAEAVTYETVGRRKRARARLRMVVKTCPPETSITVNDKVWSKYFPESSLPARKIFSPLSLTGLLGKVAVSVKVLGGGQTGQIDAITLGLARAILKLDPSKRSTLRQEGLLTRDSREKERKKPGLLRARKKPQFSKR